jgi:pyrimidine-nucleoside phosphorylase
MSKKIAGGSKAVVLDVKFGGGAFMKTPESARALAALMIRIGAEHGQRMVAVISGMDAPLGRNVGNRLEIDEVSSLLRHPEQADADLWEVVRFLAAAGFVVAGRAETLSEGRVLAGEQVRSGAAFEKLSEIVAAQGGDPDYLNDADKPPLARMTFEVRSPRDGFVAGIDALAIGLAAMRLGAGRATKDASIDPTAGIVLQAPLGAKVRAGDSLAVLYTAREDAAREVAAEVERAIMLADAALARPPLIYETLGI